MRLVMHFGKCANYNFLALDFPATCELRASSIRGYSRATGIKEQRFISRLYLVS